MHVQVPSSDINIQITYSDTEITRCKWGLRVYLYYNAVNITWWNLCIFFFILVYVGAVLLSSFCVHNLVFVEYMWLFHFPNNLQAINVICNIVAARDCSLWTNKPLDTKESQMSALCSQHIPPCNNMWNGHFHYSCQIEFLLPVSTYIKALQPQDMRLHLKCNSTHIWLRHWIGFIPQFFSNIFLIQFTLVKPIWRWFKLYKYFHISDKWAQTLG